MKIAVVIPVKNEKEGLPELVGLLLRQSLPPDEIVFVDAGSTDGSLGILERLSAENRSIRLINAPGAYCGKGRNVGIQSTDAEIIVQIDGGNLPDNTQWIEKLCAPILGGQAEYVVGGIKFTPLYKDIFGVRANMADIYGASLHDDYRQIRDETTIDGGASVAYRREVWEKAGGFPFPEYCKVEEAPLFAMKVVNLKVKIAFACDACIYWQIGPRFSDVIKRQILYQKSKFRQPKSVVRFRGTAGYPLVALVVLIVSFFVEYVWLALPAGVLMYWIKRCRKVYKIYRLREPSKISWRGCLVIMCSIAGVEFIYIFSRIVGTVSGILEIRENRRFRERMKNYLYGTSHQ